MGSKSPVGGRGDATLPAAGMTEATLSSVKEEEATLPVLATVSVFLGPGELLEVGSRVGGMEGAGRGAITF